MRACAVFAAHHFDHPATAWEKLTPVKRIRGGISDDYAVIMKLK
jgi:hypothetical protein